MSTLLARPRPWLAPLGAVFGSAAVVRASLYQGGLLARDRLRGPVVSVGNLGVGGRGKTPAVALVARWLREAGWPVSVLSRGYRGTFSGDALIVSDGAMVLASAREAGDEPVMLAHELAGVVVAVGRRRVRAGRAVEARFGRRAHVLDDGFQHLALFRDLDIVCLDPSDLAGRPLPAGDLREFPSALRRADVALLVADGTDTDAARRALEQRLAPGRVFVVRRKPEGFFDLGGASRERPLRVVLLSGIARPERFAADVRAFGTEVVEHIVYPDHYSFPADVLRGAAARASEARADAVVVTAKDAARLGDARLDAPLLVFRIHLAADEDKVLRDLILAAVNAAGGPA